MLIVEDSLENCEENSLKINLEAAREVARQLRLRDLSGLIVIDFIDMKLEKNQKKVYQELRKELRKDRAKVAVAPITEFGLLEMTRQRIRLSLADSMSQESLMQGIWQNHIKETP